MIFLCVPVVFFFLIFAYIMGIFKAIQGFIHIALKTYLCIWLFC